MYIIMIILKLERDLQGLFEPVPDILLLKLLYTGIISSILKHVKQAVVTPIYKAGSGVLAK